MKKTNAFKLTLKPYRLMMSVIYLSIYLSIYLVR